MAATTTTHSNELQALLDAAVDAIVIIDHRGNIESFNPGAEKLFGYAAAEVTGKNVSLLMTDADRQHHDEYLDRHQRTGEARIIGIGREVQAHNKQGHRFTAHLSVGRIAGTPQPRYIGILHDLTARKQAHTDLARERDRANKYLNEAREAQERMMHVSRLATMGEMASGISHELNQPLAAITTSAQAARRMLTAPKPAAADMTEALELIAAQALRAGEIIRRLRNLVRDHKTQRELRQVNELIEELGPLTRADARMNDVRVTLHLANDLPAVNVDPIQIQQVILNLVSNAVQSLEGKAAADRSIDIVTTGTVAGGVEVRVTDSGPGIAPEISRRLFEPFVTTKPDGTGLGLAISRSIIQAHGGALDYEPALPSGATFKFTLPVAMENS
jgi:two-component system sensor kinase FixL